MAAIEQKAAPRAAAPDERDAEQAPAAKNPFVGEDFTPRKEYGPLAAVDNAKVTPHDMMSFISAAVDYSGLVGHNTNSFNDLMDRGIPSIITQMFRVDRMIKNEREQTPQDRLIKSIRIQIGFSDVSVGRPVYSTFPIGRTVDLYPNRARLSGVPYAAPITLSASVTLTAHYADGRTEAKHADILPFQATKFPVMVRSNRCHTHNCTRDALKRLEEDPNEPGGYFIAKNNEWVVDLLENIRFNSLHIHLAQAQNETVRGEFISQPSGPFEHSSQVILRYMNNGSITAEINSTKFSKVRIPFYLLYRMFGMTSDRDIVATIVFDLESTSVVVANMLQILEKAMHMSDKAFESLKDELNRETIVQEMAVKLSKYLTNPSSYLNNDNAIQYLNQDLLSILDKVLLPHMGVTPESRHRKLRFLGLMLHKMFLTHMKILQPTDRDSYRHKRVHGAGVSIAKTLKTQFNNAAIGPLLRAYKREVKNNPFQDITIANMVDTFRNAMATTDLNSAMENAITAGNKTIVIKRRVATNRVSSQPLERKNFLNMICALRTITTHNASNASKQTERADMMRRVHPTYIGMIDIAHSADTGENVGMRKQMAITASVCTAGEPALLRLRLLADSVVPLDRVSGADMARKNLARIFVNGEWIGCHENAAALATRYRALRREGRIVEPKTTINWDPIVDEVEFWLDGGRLVRPLIIVDSNIEEYDAACRAAFEKKDPSLRIKFEQNVRLTREHVQGILAGTVTLDTLLQEGVTEFVTPEEQENCLVAPSIDVLRAAQNNVTARYSHCDVEQAIFGLASLVSPFGNHTQPARVTYETNQGRQTGGWYATSFPFRADKNRFWQFYNEVPLVRTLAHKYVLPNGLNTYMAYMPKDGDNQEDSAVVNQASCDRGMFAGAFWRFEKAELKQGEQFGNPDALTTKNLKPGASYEKLVDGFVPVGTVVRRGDILIGRYAKITRARGSAGAAPDPDSKYQWIDRSVMYRLDEPAIVDAVLKPRGANDELFGLVKLRYARSLGIGDKMSSRSGNKSIVARKMPQSDMPFTESGLTMDILVNPHCIPSRMTIGQLIETSLAKVCARKGVITDGTAFLKVSHEEMAEELAKHGFRYNGRERLYNGPTGEYYDAAIFVGPVFEQRLQKFVLDDEYAVAGSGPTDATTGQPLGGKNVRGGLRLGEMEAWCLESQGAMMSMFEKFNEDSDGRILYVCRACGGHAACNEAAGVYRCKVCGEAADIAAIESAKSAIVFAEELAASNIHMKLGLRPREYEERAVESTA